MTVSLQSLPPETLTLILLHAQQSDRCRAVRPYHAHVQSKDALQQQQQQQETCIHQNSALQLSRTCKRLHASALSVLYETIDLTRVKVPRRLALIHQLSQPRYGRLVRKLTVKIALGSATTCRHPGDTSTTPTTQASIDYNSALSIGQAVCVLEALPLLTSLDVRFVNALQGCYISRLPVVLEHALRRHGHHLRNFQISSDQLKVYTPSTPEEQPNDAHLVEAAQQATTVPTPFFQLDEQLVADAISLLPNLHSLTLDHISYDTLAAASPLFECVSALPLLKLLNFADSDSFNDKWTSSALAGPLESLTISSSPSSTLQSAFYAFVSLHRTTLKHLSLAIGPDEVQTPLSDNPLSNEQKYYLPELQSLSIEVNVKDFDAIAHLERYTTCLSLEHVVVKGAEGVDIQELETLLVAQRLKRLNMLEIEQDKGASADTGSLVNLVSAAKTSGVQLEVYTSTRG